MITFLIWWFVCGGVLSVAIWYGTRFYANEVLPARRLARQRRALAQAERDIMRITRETQEEMFRTVMRNADLRARGSR